MIYFMVRTTLLVVALGLVRMSSLAEADSQAGGLPAVSARVSTLEGLATTFQTQITTLQTLATTLQTQVTTLQTANTNLQNALNAESAARAAADTALNAAAVQEASDRSAGDLQLTGLINGALSVGKAYESVVFSTFLVNGQPGTVGVLSNVPAGRYFVIAKAIVRDVDHDADWTCQLFRNDETGVLNALDISAATTASGFIENESNVTMTAVATLSATGSFRVDCFTLVASSVLEFVKVTAISVQ